MKWKELQEKNENELQKLLAVSREHLRELRFKTHNEQLKNVREIRIEKKNISNILTLLKQEQTKTKTSDK
ncbi:50S ribosomal protein L29 [Patescibacteria group bacterium]|nr:50S ribosomal protein L29 [Patescibacteria group bacterium]MBU1074880.1 50S ribosomal protein L29 [Patescibacteria group bacterium]MBU1951404.1 50S ribosomal protein L29 [Patescibacteria group bacterium]MBU2235636.1 50S ribosomal protein L29 [Patescibacteria group bacterium]